MPFFQKAGGSTHWRHSRPEKKATRDTFDQRVILGPRWGITHMQCLDHGTRERVQGRWLSAVWASRIRWASKAIRDSQAQRREWRRTSLKRRITERLSTGEADVPF